MSFEETCTVFPRKFPCYYIFFLSVRLGLVDINQFTDVLSTARAQTSHATPPPPPPNLSSVRGRYFPAARLYRSHNHSGRRLAFGAQWPRFHRYRQDWIGKDFGGKVAVFLRECRVMSIQNGSEIV